MTERLSDKNPCKLLKEGCRWRGNCDKRQLWSNKCIEKLKEYETAEEEGRLVILPCKIGTIVYAIRQSWYGYVIDKKRFSYEMIGKVGRSVFFTCEEAEKALEERNDT